MAAGGASSGEGGGVTGGGGPGVGGGGTATVNPRDATGPGLPAASVAWTSNTLAPSARAEVVCGDMHAANAPGTSGVPARHANATPGSLDEKVNVGVAVVVVPVGPPVIVTAGPTVSTVNARAASGRGSARCRSP